MTTLLSPPVSVLATRLLGEAATSDQAFFNKISALSAEERDPLFASADYRKLYSEAKDQYLAVSRETAHLLYMLARATKARAIVEFGASFGVSTIHLAAALKDNGGGHLITTEFETAKLDSLAANLAAAGLSDLVEVRGGNAIESLGQDLPDAIDLVLLDGAKPLYPVILDLLEPRFVAGTLVIADNADMNPAYVARVRNPEHGYLSVPFAGDVEVSLWLGKNGAR